MKAGLLFLLIFGALVRMALSLTGRMNLRPGTVLKMRPWLLTLLLMGFASGEVFAQAASTDSVEITATVEGFHRALVQGDRTAALALLAPDTAILENGEWQSRAEYEHEHLGQDISFARTTTTTRSPWTIQQDGNIAWIFSSNRTTGTFNGRQIGSHGVELMVLAKGESGWRIRAIHWSSRNVK